MLSPPDVSASRASALRIALVVVVTALLIPAGVSAVNGETPSLGAGTITEQPESTTVISIQGFKFSGQANGKKPARLVGVAPNGSAEWVHRGETVDATWFYDVDPTGDGTLLVTATNPDGTIVYEYDPETDSVGWTQRFDLEDTHDVDRISEDELLIANMRNYNETSGENEDRLLVYNTTTDSITWEWRFTRRYDRGDGGDYTNDWTHVNDVDAVGDGRFMASVRNMDEVVVVDRESKEVTNSLGSDDDHDTIYEQHNPMQLESEDGEPTVLVADSENDRVVEYELTDDGWNRTWTLGSSASLKWPRDADRLPNGNTLVVDSLNHRVIEVTPSGDIVWEMYAPWAPFDAERVALGDEPGGPTIADQGATGEYAVRGSAGLTPGSGDGQTFSGWIRDASAGTPIAAQAQAFASRWAHVTPWIRPVWMGSWAFASLVAATLLATCWGVGEVVHRRHRLVAKVTSLRERDSEHDATESPSDTD